MLRLKEIYTIIEWNKKKEGWIEIRPVLNPISYEKPR